MSQSWSLSTVGDWSSVTTNGTAQTRTHGPTHELLTAGGQSVTTDVKGNTTLLPAVLSSSSLPSTASSLTYDFDNKLRSVDLGNNASVDVHYQYDALGRRVARTGTGGSVVYVQADQQTIADYPLSGAPATPTYRYVYGSYIDEPVVRKGAGTSGTVHYYHRNQQYSIYAITDAAANIAERYAYAAYGQPTILNAAATVIATSAISNRYTYTAREWDATVGLYHFRARWMSGLTGRFLSRDPIGYSASKDLYGVYFVMKAVDPSGKITVTPVDGNEGSIGCDGKGYRHWKFTLDSDAPCDGYIVQHVLFSCSIWDCENCKCANDVWRQSMGEYWEAWEVQGGEMVDERVKNGDSYTDRASASAEDDKCGRKLQTGSIRFYCKNSNESPNGVGTGNLKDSTESPDWGYGRLYGNPECGLSTGKLYSTGTKPDFWSSEPIESAQRSSSLSYSCCKGSSSQYAYFYGKP